MGIAPMLEGKKEQAGESPPVFFFSVLEKDIPVAKNKTYNPATALPSFALRIQGLQGDFK